MLGDFMVKDAKFGMEICIKLKISKVKTKFGVLQIITLICATDVQKDF